MSKYFLRLDDASEYMDEEKWLRMEHLLDKYSVKPIYGIIPHNEDPDLLIYNQVDNFWNLMQKWQNKGWTPALHGYSHVFETKQGGINPINTRSEFAGVDFSRQCQKIKDGYRILKEHNIIPTIFFAPAHTFDDNTLKALENETMIRIISDTVADDVYFKSNFYFIPQQSGKVRRLPFKTVTFFYHPNIMNDSDFDVVDKFLSEHGRQFGVFDEKVLKKRKFGIKDYVLKKMYFARRK
jgi:hypothetical protein